VKAPHTKRRYPYWKVQVWDSRLAAWRDVQKAHYSETAAWAACPSGGRLMRVEREGRFPLV